MRELDSLCTSVIEALQGVERFQRRFHPPAISGLLQDLLPFLSCLDDARRIFSEAEAIEEAGEIHRAIARSADLVADALRLITSSHRGDLQETVIHVMQAFRKCCRAQEQLFLQRRFISCLNPFFLEPPVRGRADELDPDPPPRDDTGLRHAGLAADPYARGALSFYVPESYDGARAWPLVVALHGGFGHGRDFLWSWLREARSRQFLLLAPTSRGTTWSLLNPEVDVPPLVSLIEKISRNLNVDRNHILLTGISDGATFALLNSLQARSPFTAFAAVSGVLPPADPGNVTSKRIYWVHGALDWMFPVQTVRNAAHLLEQAGAEITFRVLKDLSHTYPREENDRILTWFDPRLALQS